LERGKHLEPRQIVRVGGSGHGYGNFGPAGRREHCLARQREILKEVSQLSTSLGVTQRGTVFTCETAGHFYNVHVRPRIEQFESSLELQGGANDPFALHYQQKWGNGNGNGLINTSEAVLNRMERLTHLFVELEDYSPFEWMPFARLQMDYLVNSLSTVVGASINGFVQEMDKYEEKSGSGPSFTTIVVDGASHMTDAALAVVLAYNRNRTRRVVLTGDVRSSTVVPSSFSRLSSEALYVGAKMNMSLYERLSKDNDSRGESSSKHVHDLMVHHRSRGAITSMYQWRYGSAMQTSSSGGNNGGGNNRKTKNKKQFANAGLMYPTQFIDVNGSQELSCPQGGYQNIQEAEYIVSVYQYLRLCGHSARSIVILTTYDDQASLIKDVMNLRCVDSSHFSKPSDICTLEQYVGRECDSVLFSLVRTSAIPESIESMTALINALSRARLGLYIFGDKQLYDNSFSLTPALSKYNNITSKLCLVAGEKNPTKRGVDERGQVGNVCSIENGLHMATVVRMMVGVPLLPGSVMKR
jgi:intron-binding protein aquarius